MLQEKPVPGACAPNCKMKTIKPTPKLFRGLAVATFLGDFRQVAFVALPMEAIQPAFLAVHVSPSGFELARAIMSIVAHSHAEGLHVIDGLQLHGMILWVEHLHQVQDQLSLVGKKLHVHSHKETSDMCL